MIDELKNRLTGLGLSEEMSQKAIETVGEFAKSKIPDTYHSAIDSILEGNAPDLGSLGGLLGGLKGFFGGK